MRASRLGVGWKYYVRIAPIWPQSLAILALSSPGQPHLTSASQMFLTCWRMRCSQAVLRPIIDLNNQQSNHMIKSTLAIRRIFTRLSPSFPLRLRYHKSESQPEYGLKFDEQEIKRKMSQIKQRKQGGGKKPQGGGKLEFMNIDSNSEVARRIKKYRQSTGTENLLDFTDVTVEQKPTILQVTGFNEESIEIDNMVYPYSLIVFPTQALLWEVASLQTLSIDQFIILKYINPKPAYVIVGVNDPEKFPKSIAEYLRTHYDNFDCLEMFEAVSQFNTTSNDDIKVVGFFFSK